MNKLFKIKLFILLLLLAMTLTGCSTDGQNNNNSAEHLSQKLPAYLPAVELWKGTSRPIKSIVENIHSVKFKDGCVVAAVSNHDLIVSSPDQNNDPRYPDGLYIVDTTTGKVTALLHVNANNLEQINIAAANQKWLVYELVTYGSPGKSSLYAYNWVTKKSYKIYSVLNDELSDLYVEGDQCIWSHFIENDTSNEVISEIHDYNLEARKDGILLCSKTNQISSTSSELNQHDYKNGIIFSASAGGGKVVFSLHDGANPNDASSTGDIYEIDLGSKQISHLLHLYHDAFTICSYGDRVVMETNYNPAPKSPEDPVTPAPYPVYLYSKGNKSIYQLSPDRNAEFPTQNNRFIAWRGDAAEKPQVYDLKTGTYYTVPGYDTKIIGCYITWLDPQTNMLYWAQLPD